MRLLELGGFQSKKDNELIDYIPRVSQLVPMYPSWQEHEYPKPDWKSEQFPPFWQGVDEQANTE